MATAQRAAAPATSAASLDACAGALAAAERILHLARSAVGAKSSAAGRSDSAQHALHGLAWLATYVEALRQMLGWAQRLEAEGRAGEMERLRVLSPSAVTPPQRRTPPSATGDVPVAPSESRPWWAFWKRAA